MDRRSLVWVGTDLDYLAGAEVHDSGDPTDVTCHVLPSFGDGEWHQARLPLDRFCNATHNDTILPFFPTPECPKGATAKFDPKHVVLIRVEQFSVTGDPFTMNFDDIGFDDH